MIGHVIDNSPEIDNAVRDIITNDIAKARDSPVDVRTEDRAEISARTENDVPRDISDIDYDNVTVDVATYSLFQGDVSKDTDNDVSSDVFDEDLDSDDNDYCTKREIVDHHECHESARTDDEKKVIYLMTVMIFFYLK